MDRLLLYTTVGNSPNYLRCLEWFCKSLMYTNPRGVNLLIICDAGFHTKIEAIVKDFAFLKWFLLDMPDSSSSVEASMHKVRIFDFPHVHRYHTILYVDLDCIFQGDISFVLEKEIKDNKLYVFTERESVNDNTHPAYSLRKEDNPDECYYTSEHFEILQKYNKLPFNAGLFLFRCSPLMEQHFRALNTFIRNFKGEYFYEQSFMNTCFNLNNVSDYSLFNKGNIFMLHNNWVGNIQDNHRVVHFNNFLGEGATKAGIMKSGLMETYFNSFKDKHPVICPTFETRDQMVSALISPDATIVEIGVFKGDFAEVLVATNPKLLYLVDCWAPEPMCSGDADGNNLHTVHSGYELWDVVKKRFEFYPNIDVRRSYSSDFLATLEDRSVDVVYIDGDQSYEGVRADLQNSCGKVKVGGWIMGHDYEMNMTKAHRAYDFGVKRAVDEFCAEKGLTITTKAMDGCVSYAIHVSKGV